MLENALKAQKLRTTLGIFDRSRFFFNLPGSLAEYIEAVSQMSYYWYSDPYVLLPKGRYEAAMRDYKKGKFMLESRSSQILPIGTKKDSQGPGSAEQQQRRILDKVWGTVEKVMGEMRNQLLGKLQEPSRSVEDQEKTLE